MGTVIKAIVVAGLLVLAAVIAIATLVNKIRGVQTDIEHGIFYNASYKISAVLVVLAFVCFLVIG